jgi:hypothetical protein
MVTERRMGRVWIGALALLAGAGCDSGAPPTEKRKVVIANPHHEQLMKLSELNRSLALRRAIQDSREYCKKIVSSAYVGPYKGQQMWAGPLRAAGAGMGHLHRPERQCAGQELRGRKVAWAARMQAAGAEILEPSSAGEDQVSRISSSRDTRRPRSAP